MKKRTFLPAIVTLGLIVGCGEPGGGRARDDGAAADQQVQTPEPSSIEENNGQEVGQEE